MLHEENTLPQVAYISQQNIEIEKLRDIQNYHKIWRNPLLLACEKGELDLKDFKFYFLNTIFIQKISQNYLLQ